MGKFKRIKTKCLSVITALVILLMPLTLPVNAVTTASEAVEADETAVTNTTVPTVHVLTHTFGGLSVLLEYNGHFGLVDSGEDKDSPATDSGYWHTGTTGTLSKASEDYSIPYFKSLGVTKDNFDFFIGTHPHSDHIGAADEIIREFRPKKVYLQEYSDSYVTGELWDNRYVYENTVAAARATGAELIQNINSSNANFTLGGAMEIQIKNYGDDYKYQPTDDANDFSLGVLVTANGKRMFISGDINNFGGDEDKLAKEIGDIDALVLGHHGCYGSNSYNYVTTLNPELMIIPGSFSNVSEKGLLYDKGLLETLWYMGTKENPSQLFATSWLEEKGYDSLDVYLNSDGVTTNVPTDFEYFAQTKMENGVWIGYNYVNGYLAKKEVTDNCYTPEENGVKYKYNFYYKDKNFTDDKRSAIGMTGDWVGDENSNYIEGHPNAWKFKSTATGQYLNGKNYIYGAWYYFDNGGKIKTGWEKNTENGIEYDYYFGPDVVGGTKEEPVDGKMRYGWLSTDDGNTFYYLALDGKMMTNGWITIDGKRYFFFPKNYNNESGIPEGAMAKNRVVGSNQYVGSDGVYQEAIWNGNKVTIGGTEFSGGWLKWSENPDFSDEGYYYIDSTTKEYVTGLRKIDGKVYYFSPGGLTGYHTGQMVTGPCWVNENDVNKLYYFSTGTELRPEPYDINKDETKHNADKSQLTTEGCRIQINNAGDPWILTKDGKWYILNDDNTLTTGWRDITDLDGNVTTYYFDKNTGLMQIGLFYDSDKSNYYYLRIKGDGGSEGAKVTTPGVFTTGYGKSYYVTNTDGVIYTSGTGWRDIADTSEKTYTYYLYDDYSLAKGATKIGDEIFYFVNDGEEDLLGQPVGSLVKTVGFIHSTDGNVYYVYGNGTDKTTGGNGYAVGRLFDNTMRANYAGETWDGWLRIGDDDNTKEYYCFDDLAVMRTGFFETDNNEGTIRRYYLAKPDDNITVNSITFKEGQMIYGGKFTAYDGNNYFARNSITQGDLLTGVQKNNTDGKYYYFINGDEVSLTNGQPANTADKYKQVTAQGWITDKSGNKYYVKEDGTLAVGATKIDNKWYYFRAGGETEVPDGATDTLVCALVTTTGWIEIKNENDPYKYTRYYVFGSDTNDYSVGRLFDDSMSEPLKDDETKSWRSWLPLYVTENDKEYLEFYRFDNNAEMMKGFVNDGEALQQENRYYLDPEGKITINGVNFKKGQMVYGGKFQAYDSNYYFANNSNNFEVYGKLLTGVKTDVDGKNYYFQTGTEKQLPDGSTASTANEYKQVTAKGWVLTESDVWYYIDGDGVCYPSSKGLTVSNNVLENNTENSLNDKDTSGYNFKISRKDGDALTPRERECASVQRSAKQVNEDGTFTLKAGEIVTFTGLVSDKEYIVESTDNNDNSWIISTKYSTDGTNYLDGKSVEIPAKESVMQNVTFNNYIYSLKINLKYYGREATNGKPADIKKEPTIYTKYYIGQDYLNYKNDSNNPDYVGKMILDTGVAFDSASAQQDTKYKNVLDGYEMWITQAQAKSYIENKTNLHTYSNYADGTYHTNWYGYTQTNNQWDDTKLTDKTADGEKWVTYYDSSKNEVSEANKNNGTVTEVTVWLFNQPKQYTVTAYEAKETGTHFNRVGDKYVVSGESTKTIQAYYNQRLGLEIDKDAEYSQATNHLKGYGIDSYVGTKLETAYTVKNGDTTLKFAYWAFDPEGKKIASTDILYNYRIVTKTTLYAVYTSEGTVNDGKPGLTVSENERDIFFNSSGKSITRLNTEMNPYNCQNNDTNIKNVAITYIIPNSANTEIVDVMPETTVEGVTYVLLSDVQNAIKATLNYVRDENIDKKFYTITYSDTDISLTGIKKGNYFVFYVDGHNIPENELTGVKDISLTNKNRIEFGSDFQTKALSGKRMYAFAAMYYTNDWIVSDNFIDYDFR